jgi:beta-lactamase regulating signal transducer with metallopeptidase domain
MAWQSALPALGANIFIGGLIIAGALAAASAIAKGMPARLRYLAALTTFAAAISGPLLWTLVPAFRPAFAFVPSAGALSEALASAPFDSIEPGWSAGTLLAAIWIAVAALLLVREYFGHRVIARRRHGWKPAGPAILRSLRWPGSVPLFLSHEDGPAAIGLLRPAVVLPESCLEGLPEHTVTCIAQHELAHIRWRDPQVNAILRCLRAIFWPSLALWWIERMIHAEREAAADEEAAAGSTIDRAGYATALVDAAAWARIARRDEWAVAARLGTKMEDRIMRLVGNPKFVAMRAAAASIVLVAGAALAAATMPAKTETAQTAQRAPAAGAARHATSTLTASRNQSPARAATARGCKHRQQKRANAVT